MNMTFYKYKKVYTIVDLRSVKLAVLNICLEYSSCSKTRDNT